MIPYFFILFVVTLWIYIEKRSFGRKSLYFPFFCLLLLFSLRDFSVGTDTIVYTDKFINLILVEYYNFNNNIEFGYQVLEYLVLSFSHNYFWLFLLCGSIILSGFFYILRKYSSNYLLSIFVFITFGIYTFSFNILRQGLAISICFFALHFLIQRKFLYYFLSVAIASLFHVSALIMLIFPFLLQFKIKIEYKMLIVFLFSSVFSSVVISYLSRDNVRYEAYNQASELAGGYFVLLFYLFWVFLLYFFGRKERILNIKYAVLEQIYILGIILVIPIALLGTNPSGPQRLLSYFSPLLMLLIPIIIERFNSRVITFLFIIVSCIYFYLNLFSFGDLIPYSLNPIFEVF
ncbi:EpsG family protein [Acinetobacter sp. YH12102]|uniref:EpsG family protein n=1 Tax=Acinetobacter sp. YH12102 TaxID=2601091 RepID=UPI0015D3E150|nr:EpsG family protein [Acinetobacter sp. YH12102]